MNKFKSICAMIVLALSLSVPVYADDMTPGDGHTPGTPNPVDPGQIPPETPDSITVTFVTDNGVIVINVIVAVIGLV
jgi:hypothetical protein